MNPGYFAPPFDLMIKLGMEMAIPLHGTTKTGIVQVIESKCIRPTGNFGIELFRIPPFHLASSKK